jgi:hypothetical protein
MPAIDNLTEMLNLIIQFTHLRRQIITLNIQNAETPGYRPQDLPVEVFSQLLNDALNGHLQFGRLVWQDASGISFGQSGNLSVTPLFDARAASLKRVSGEAYLNHQTRLFLENELNKKVADRLISQRLSNDASYLH